MKRGTDYIGVGVGAVIVNKEGKILLTLRGKQAQNQVGKWECPGGAVEFNETLKDTILREVKEELDIEIEIIELLGIADDILPFEKQHWVAPSFLCKIKKGTPKNLEPHKCEKIEWFTLNEARKLDLSIATQQTIRFLLQKHPNLSQTLTP